MAIVLDPTNGITNVNGTAAAPAITGLDTDTGLYFGTNTLGLSTNGTASINVDSSQNVGINVTPNTGFKLTVQGPGTSTTKYSNPIARFQTNGSGYDGYIQISDNVANSIAIGQLSGATYFAQNGTESMRIDSSGNLLIGASTNANSGKVAITSNANSADMIDMYDTTPSAYGGYYIAFRNSSNALAGYILHSGATTVTYNSVSDYRLKENVKPIENALDRVSQIKPVTYTWIDTDGEQGEGFIAHELQEVCPLAVGGKKDDVNEDGSIKPQGVDYSKITALLTKAIQEQQAIIEDLKARIETLESK